MADADTAAKRLAMADFGEEATAPGIPAPTGGFEDNSERYHLLWLYVPATFATPSLGSTRQPLLSMSGGMRTKWKGISA